MTMIKRKLAQLLIAVVIAALLMPTVALAATATLAQHIHNPATCTTDTNYNAQTTCASDWDYIILLVLVFQLDADPNACNTTDAQQWSSVKRDRYTAFGNELNLDPNNTNPFRWGGMYWDWHRGEHLTPNRMYNPRIGRWTQEDPFWNIGNMRGCKWSILQSGNLFVGMVNNPVRWTDPTGLYIKLTGTSEQRHILLSYIDKLTDHTLGFCSNGMVFIANQAIDNFQFVYGNALIERMIAHELGVSVELWNDQNVFLPADRYLDFENAGTVGVIRFNPNAQPMIITQNPITGLNEVGARPLEYVFIAMAHELIHADRAMRGISMPSHIRGTHSFQVQRAQFNPRRVVGPGRGAFFTATHTNVRLEELATVGVGGHHTSTCITENMIRREHEMPMRTTFGYIMGNTRIVH